MTTGRRWQLPLEPALNGFGSVRGVRIEAKLCAAGMRVDEVQQLLKQQQPLRGAKSCAKYDAVEMARLQAPLRHVLGGIAKVYQATDYFIAQRTQTFELRVDEGAHELGRQGRGRRKFNEGGIKPEGKYSDHF